jgi:demethylmenaquinone methyltransferase/2-methoxy-6-polyprenyl-1,4-benzoquinol methylase
MEKMTMSRERNQISRVTRSKEIAKASYDRMSKWYDIMAGSSEWKFVKIGLDLLKASKGETVLDIGFGTGKSVLSIAQSVGQTGHVYGLDLSEGMHRIASDRVGKAGLSGRVDLKCGDAVKLTFEDDFFDAVFTSFTLELFDIPEIPIVLHECKRVLRNGKRIVVVSMSKKSRESLAVRLYEWAHEKLPNYVDCRPIYVTESLLEAGFQVIEQIEIKMWGLPVDAVLARKTN